MISGEYSIVFLKNIYIFIFSFRYYGSFKGLDADEVTEYTDNVWRTLYKLLKLLSDNPGAKRIAEMSKAKVEKFKQFVPVLQCICNRGLQKRHWDKVTK